MILNRKKVCDCIPGRHGSYVFILCVLSQSQAQQQRISVLEKEADLSMRLNKQAYVNFVDEDDYLPEGKLPPIKKALSQKSISSRKYT